MRIFGLDIRRTKAIPNSLQSVDADSRGWFRVLESFTGAWQQNVEVRLESVLTHPTVFACITLIASDVAKMSLLLAARNSDDIWVETRSDAFSPVLDQPNRFQDQKNFIESWVFSKLIWGNTYVLKSRDGRNVTSAMYVLDPARVRPLVAPDGSVYYELKKDNLSQQPAEVDIVPASAIIHDRWNCFYHPLVGLPPLHASGLAAVLGLKIQTNSTLFFGNGSNPSGILTAPTEISQTDADEIKAYWSTNFSGDNTGKIAVLSGGMTYAPMSMTAQNSQLNEQWESTSKAIASTFHVPWHLVGGPPPPYNNIQALTVQYFTQCIQKITVKLEWCLDKGLALPSPYGTMFDIDDLMWMDSATMMAVIKEGVRGGVLTPNEGRKRLNYGPIEGGNTVYLQEQDHSLEALSRRDQSDDPFGKKADAPQPKPAPEPMADPPMDEDKFMAALMTKAAALAQRNASAA